MALVALSLGSSPAPAMLDDVRARHGQRLPSVLRMNNNTINNCIYNAHWSWFKYLSSGAGWGWGFLV